jgi:hypothetical protein
MKITINYWRIKIIRKEKVQREKYWISFSFTSKEVFPDMNNFQRWNNDLNIFNMVASENNYFLINWRIEQISLNAKFWFISQNNTIMKTNGLKKLIWICIDNILSN